MDTDRILRRTTLMHHLMALVLGTGVVVSAMAQPTVLPVVDGLRKDPVVAGRLHVCFSRDALATEPAWSLAARHGLRLRRPLLAYEQSVRATLATALVTMSPAMERVLEAEEPLLRTYTVDYDPIRGEPELVARRLRRPCGDIEEADPVFVATPCGFDLPNDSLASEQALLATLGMPEAWAIENGDSTMWIGISDSGVRIDHEDLVDRIAVNDREIPDNGIDDDGNGYVDDYQGYNFTAADDDSAPGDPRHPTNTHGTGVAGICGATRDNGLGIAGIAGACRMVPLRTMPAWSSGIVYGYESLLYCATNGIPVVNCSWGSQSKSCTDERVVAYVIARGTAIVAAAGNHGQASPFYPAAYPGVLGVGVTEPDDRVVGMTGRGPHVDVMAPGQSSLTTSIDGGYQGFCCTSGSSPIVAALVALVRHRHPQLGPEEACALVRVGTVDIVGVNPVDGLLLPGRVHAPTILRLRPDSVPSFSLDVRRIGTVGADRWGVGDTVTIDVVLRNELAEARELRVEVEAVGPSASAVNVRTPSIDIGTVPSHDSVQLPSALAVVVVRATDTTAFLRLRITATTAAGDPFGQLMLVPVVPAPSWRTLANDVLQVSVGDNGRIGNTDIARGLGAGVTYRTSCGLLYEGGLMVGAGGRVVDNVRAIRGTNDHFVSVKPFRSPSAERGTVSDAGAPDSLRLGITVDHSIFMPGGDTAIFVDDVTITNVSGSVIDDPGMAWFFDWDVGANPARDHVVSLSMPAPGVWSGALVTGNDAGAPKVRTVVVVDDVAARPFVLGMDNTTTYAGFARATKDSLIRGLGEHHDGTTDVAVVAGATFGGPWYPGQRRNMRLIIAMDGGEPFLPLLMERFQRQPMALSPTVGRPYPQPAGDHLTIPVSFQETGTLVAVVYDAVGQYVRRLEWSGVGPGSMQVHVDVADLLPGMYSLVLSVGDPARREGTGRSVVPLCIVR